MLLFQGPHLENHCTRECWVRRPRSAAGSARSLPLLHPECQDSHEKELTFVRPQGRDWPVHQPISSSGQTEEAGEEVGVPLPILDRIPAQRAELTCLGPRRRAWGPSPCLSRALGGHHCVLAHTRTAPGLGAPVSPQKEDGRCGSRCSESLSV